MCLICQREHTELVEDALYVGDRGRQPAQVVPIDAWGEEGDNHEEFTGIGTEFAEGYGGGRELYGCFEALIVFCLKYLRVARAPLLG